MIMPIPILIQVINISAPSATAGLVPYFLKPDEAETRKPESLLARAMLRKLLSEQTVTDPQEWTFQKEKSGKPYALFKGASSPFAISLSHSGPHVACTVAQVEALGIDIEIKRDTRDLDGVASIAFGKEERKLVAREGLDTFYRIWALREAHAKATGGGLAQAADGMDRFTTALPAGGTLHPKAIQGHWFIAHEEPIAGLQLAVAAKLAEAPKRTPVLVWADSTAASD